MEAPAPCPQLLVTENPRISRPSCPSGFFTTTSYLPRVEGRTNVQVIFVFETTMLVAFTIVPPSSNRTVAPAWKPVPASPDLAGLLAHHKATTGGGPDDHVFHNKAGDPIDYHNIERREFHPALERAGLRKIRWHDLRHTFVALLVANGEYPTKIQELMGHADIGTTFNTYGHLMPDSSNGVGERLDSLVCLNGSRWPTGELRRIK